MAGGISTQEASSAPRGIMAIPMRPTSPTMPSGDGASLSDVLSRLKQAFGLAGKAGLEGYAQALTGQDEQGRSVGSILPFAKDERTGEVGLASPRILDLWNTAGGAVPAKGVTLGAGPVLRGAERAAEALPMDQASRMARAKDLGFDTSAPVYHGTNRDVGEFSPRRASKKEQMGLEGTHVANDPNFAAFYADGDGANVMPVYIRREGLVDASQIIKVGSKDEEILRDLLKGTGIKPYVSDGIMPPLQGYIDQVSQAKAEKVLKKHGVTGVIYDAKYGSLVPGGMSVSGKSKSAVVFDPKNIRSTQAAFDPAKRDSADLLASRAAPGSLGIGGNDRRRLTFRDIEDEA